MIGKKLGYAFVAALMLVNLWATAGWSASTIESYLTITDLQVSIYSPSTGQTYYPEGGGNYAFISGQAEYPEQPLYDTEYATGLDSHINLSFSSGPWFTSISSQVSYNTEENLGAISLSGDCTAPQPSGTDFGSVGISAMAKYQNLFFPDLPEGDYNVQVQGSYTYHYKMIQDPDPYPFYGVYFEYNARIEGEGLGNDQYLIPLWSEYFFTPVDDDVNGTITYSSAGVHFDAGDQYLTVHSLMSQSGGVSPVPVPGAVWLLGSGLAGLLAWRRFV